MSAASAQSLFWISLGALLVPMISRRIKVPSAVGELIFGIVFGSHVLGLITRDDFIDLMAQLGFAILMFSAGMEIDFAPLRKRGSRILSIGWQWVIITFLGGWAAVTITGLGPWPVLAVCSVSIGLASVFLRERGLLGSGLGQAVLAAGLIGESLSILLLTVLDFHHQLGFSREFFFSVSQFAGIFVLAYLFMRVFRFIIWWYPKKIQAFIESGDPLELGVRLAIALLFIFVAAAAALHVESILGAFIAGALFGFIFQEREVVADKINAIGQGFFVPIFFIVVGSHFDPLTSLLGVSPAELGLLLLVALTVKLVPSLVFIRMGLGWREILGGGLLFSAPLTLTVAVAEIGERIGALSSSMKGSLIVVAITTGLICPFLARIIVPAKGEQNGREESVPAVK